MFKAVILSLAALTFLVGCRSSRVGVPTPDYRPTTTGTLFLAPPRDLVYANQVVAGSGMEFQALMLKWLRVYAPTLTVVTSSSGCLKHEEAADLNMVIKEACAAGAERTLVLRLGLVRDAAPMSFRQDYVILESGALYEVTDRRVLWSVSGYKRAKGNIGGYHGLLDSMAKLVAYNLTRG